MRNPEERYLPHATPELAKATWARMARPSARKVARAMRQAGFVVSFPTVARWKREGWQRAEQVEHPLDAARSALDCAIPVLSGQPTLITEDLIIGNENKDQLQALSADELLRAAAREALVTFSVVEQILNARLSDMVNEKPMETAALIEALASFLQASTSAMQQALALKPPTR